jgi:hypothetical protein
MTPFDVYKTYLALKNHFTKDSYDYHKYCGKSRATLNSFYKRNDRYWFERISRQKTDNEVVDFFLASFVSCSDPETYWIGNIIKEGQDNYNFWSKKIQSLSYIFKDEIIKVFQNKNFDDLFNIKGNTHPEIVKEHLKNNLSLESLIILNKILGFKTDYDKKMDDPVWKFLSMRIKKYDAFLNIDVFKYKKILKECIL